MTNRARRNSHGAVRDGLRTCRSVDLPVPWDKADMAREVSADLRKFERLNFDLAEVEVLAWRRTEREGSFPFPFPPNAPIAPRLKDKIDVVLLWGRLDTAPERLVWALIQAGRNPDDRNSKWRRSLFNIEWKDAPAHLRPGYTTDGTWHGFQLYTRPPTSSDICAFASVHFLPAPEGGYRTSAAAIERRTWRRVAGAEPTCGLDW